MCDAHILPTLCVFYIYNNTKSLKVIKKSLKVREAFLIKIRNIIKDKEKCFKMWTEY